MKWSEMAESYTHTSRVLTGILSPVFLVMLLLSMITISFPAMADLQSAKTSLDTLQVSDSADPEIQKLYKELSQSVNDYEKLTQNYQSDLSDNAAAMKETEQSTANKTLGALSIGATGIGGMQLASGLAEKSADESAVREMNALIATFRCGIGDQSQNIEYGATHALPAYSTEFISLAQQYRDLAAQTKEAKLALGLKPGIESEEILDSGASGLYDNKSIGKTENTFDTASERLASGNAANKIKTGAIVTGAGVVGGIAGNLIINKDAPKERSKEIKNEFDTKSRKIETDIKNKESALQKAIEDNEQKIKKYNELIKAHRESAKKMCVSE